MNLSLDVIVALAILNIYISQLRIHLFKFHSSLLRGSKILETRKGLMPKSIKKAILSFTTRRIPYFIRSPYTSFLHPYSSMNKKNLRRRARERRGIYSIAQHRLLPLIVPWTLFNVLIYSGRFINGIGD